MTTKYQAYSPQRKPTCNISFDPRVKEALSKRVKELNVSKAHWINAVAARELGVPGIEFPEENPRTT